MLEVLQYVPIQRGLILLILSGFTFPLAGVFVLRMNLLPLRFLLMHGALLGGALGLASRINPSILSLAINLLLIFILNKSTKILRSDYGQLSLFLMVFSVAAASIITSVFRIPAKDSLSILWGSLYSNSNANIVFSAALSLGLILFSSLYFKKLTVIFYDKDLAASLGIHVSFFELLIMLITSLVVAAAMNLMGALLLDVQLILPVVIAGFLASGLRQTMIYSCLAGGIFSLLGFVLAVVFDIPVSSGIALPAALSFIVILFLKRGKNHEVHP